MVLMVIEPQNQYGKWFEAISHLVLMPLWTDVIVLLLSKDLGATGAMPTIRALLGMEEGDTRYSCLRRR
jgi:hypothetical protein